MSLMKVFVAGAAVVFLSGCAHSIKVEPDLTNIDHGFGTFTQSKVNVGYYIPPKLISLEVTTPGGGGDNVSYYPYRDIKPGFRKMLSNVFSGVVEMPFPPDYSRATQQGLDYIIQPQMVTSSGSTGFFTWPPTDFSVDLTSKVRNANGKLIASPRVVGVGTAETSERMQDHGIAGKRAMEDALSKMQIAIKEIIPQGQTKSTPLAGAAQPKNSNTAVTRLSRLKDLKQRGLLSQEEYEAKRKEILNAL